MIAIAAAIGVGVALLLTIPRLFSGPSLYDRALAGSAIMVQAALICAVLAAQLRRAEIIDVALALLLCVLVANAAALKFFRSRSFQPPMARSGENT